MKWRELIGDIIMWIWLLGAIGIIGFAFVARFYLCATQGGVFGLPIIWGVTC